MQYKIYIISISRWAIDFEFIVTTAPYFHISTIVEHNE